MRKFALAALVAAAPFIAAPAHAVITVYSTLASFTAATTGQGTDTFNDLLPAGSALAASLNRTAGTRTYTVSDTATVLYSAGTTADAWLSNDTNAASIVFNTFSSGVSAIGGNFFGSNVSGAFVAAPLGLTITATDASGTVTQTLISPTQTTFLGFVSTGGLTQLTVTATVPNSSYWGTVNNLVLAAAAPVPEPGSWALMIGGVGLIGAAIRHSRKAVAV